MRNFLHYLFALITVFCLTVGILNYSHWKQITNPSLYTDALDSSGIYNQVSEILESYTVYAVSGFSDQLITQIATSITESVFQRESGPGAIALTGVITSMVREKLPEVVSKGFESLEVQTKIQTNTNTAITGVVLWLKGEKNDPQIFRFIPSTKELESAKSQGIVKVASTYLLANIMGVTNLPQCETKEEASASLYAIDSGQIKNVKCVTEEIRPLLYQQVQSTIPTKITDQLQLALEGVLERYNITPITESIYMLLLGLAYIKQFALEIRDILGIMKSTGIFLILVSIPALIVTVVTAKRNRVRGIGVVLLTSGIIILSMIAVERGVGYYIIKSLNIPAIDISNNVITEARSSVVMQSVENILVSISIGLYQDALTSGLFLVVFGSAIIIIGIIFHRLSINVKLNAKAEKMSGALLLKIDAFKKRHNIGRKKKEVEDGEGVAGEGVAGEGMVEEEVVGEETGGPEAVREEAEVSDAKTENSEVKSEDSEIKTETSETTSKVEPTDDKSVSSSSTGETTQKGRKKRGRKKKSEI